MTLTDGYHYDRDALKRDAVKQGRTMIQGSPRGRTALETKKIIFLTIMATIVAIVIVAWSYVECQRCVNRVLIATAGE